MNNKRKMKKKKENLVYKERTDSPSSEFKGSRNIDRK
jgi:hypothetical protein